MEIKKTTLKRTSFILGILFIGVILFIFNNINNSTPSAQDKPNANNSPVIEGDKQILDLTAKYGYAPSVINAKANLPAILKVKTSTTFDCSSAFTIPSLNIRKNLPPTGITEIEIPAQESGSVINGTCSMGMYNFKINFN